MRPVHAIRQEARRHEPTEATFRIGRKANKKRLPPVRRSNLHEWANTLIAGVAMIIAGGAAYFSWQANQIKEEDLAILRGRLLDCAAGASVAVAPHDKLEAEMSFCWQVTFANRSEDRLSLVEYHVVELADDGSFIERVDYQHLRSADGNPLVLSLSLDGGEAKQLLVMVPTDLPPAVGKLFQEWQDTSNRSLASLKRSEIELRLASSGIDVAGNSVADSNKRVHLPESLLRVTTGRGKNYDLQLAFSDSEEW